MGLSLLFSKTPKSKNGSNLAPSDMYMMKLKKKRKKKFNISSFISTRRVAFLLFASLIWSQNWNFKFRVENFKQAMRITQLLRGTHVSRVVHVCSQIWSLLRILKAHLSDQIAHFSRGQTIGPWPMPMHIDVQLFLLLIILSNVVQRIEIPYRMREILLIKTKKKKKLHLLEGTNKISINSFAKWYESFYWPRLNQYWNLCDLRVKAFNQHCIGSSLTKASCGWITSDYVN